MIYLLDFILLFNLIVAYIAFKNILAPPVLMGTGMLLASFICTYNYDVYEMDVMLMETVIILGGGSLLFTIFCLLMMKRTVFKNRLSFSLCLEKYNITNLSKIYIILDLLAFFCFLMKMYMFASFFGGNLSGSELIGEAKADASTGDMTFHFPLYITLLAFLGRTMSFFTCWFLSLSILSKDKNKLFQFLLSVHLLLIIADGFTSGTKDSIFDPVFRFAVILTYIYYVKRKSTRLTKRMTSIILMAILSLLFGIMGISELIGRNGLDDFESSDQYFAVYFGAEIKNFDIYMHGWDGNAPNKYIGQSTFSRLYEDIIPNYKPEKGAFQDIKSVRLGNVYTQWFSFHKDFGYLGVILMTFLMAIISMYVYNNSLRSLKHPMKPNIFLLIYSSISMCIFMSFFSSRFTHHVFTFFFIRRILLFWIIIYLLEHHPALVNRGYMRKMNVKYILFKIVAIQYKLKHVAINMRS